MSTSTTPTRGRSIGRFRPLAVGAVAGVAMLGAACTPPPTPTPPTTTTTPPAVEIITNATLDWTISREADNGTFAPGQVNYWSAGESDSTSATYDATDGDITVLKKNAAGTYVPIGSEASVSWANRAKNGNGTTVTATNSTYLDQLVRFSNGTGTVNTATGESTISWDGTFTINFYGEYVPFWITDPVLNVAANGTGTLTADMGGYASDIGNPGVRTPLPAVSGIVIAELPDVYASGNATTGFTAETGYLGNAVTTPAGSPQVLQTPANTSYWGAWPQSFVDFQEDTGLGTYWYTSGGSADSKKPQDPLTVSYSI